jgi:hypothetical protein
MKLSDREIHEGLGLKAPQEAPPQNRTEATLRDVGDLDGRLARMVEGQRRPNESTEQASARFMQENPSAYAIHKREKARLLRANGIGDAASGQGF